MYTHEYTESFCSPVGGPSQSDMAGDWGGPGQSLPASWLSAHRWSVLCFALSDSHTLLFVSLYPSFFQQTVQWPVGMSIRRSHTSPLDTKFVTSCPLLDPVPKLWQIWFRLVSATAKKKKVKIMNSLLSRWNRQRKIFLTIFSALGVLRNIHLWGGRSSVFHKGALAYNWTMAGIRISCLVIVSYQELKGQVTSVWTAKFVFSCLSYEHKKAAFVYSLLSDYRKRWLMEGGRMFMKPWRVTDIASRSESSHYKRTQWKVLVAAS